jgi:hypothetical protein
MPVVSAGPWQVRPANNGQAMYAEAKELAALVDQQFGAVRGAGAGIAGLSCCAGVAVVPAGDWHAAVSVFTGAALPFAVVYGNSRMLAGGLAMGVAGGHAERAALTAAAAGPPAPLTLYTNAVNNAVLYVELLPCIAGHNCHAWLGLGGNPPQHPYVAAFPGVNVTLNCWYGHPNTPAMGAHHGATAANQLAAVAAW